MKPNRCLVSGLIALVACAGVSALADDRLPFESEEYIVNTTTLGNQTVPDGIDLVNFTSSDPAGPSVDTDDAGRYVVVWSDENDGDGNGIYARGFNADGSELFAEILVNIGTTGVQENPHVAVDADGDFVVVWESDPTGSNLEIFARGFNANGTERFAELQVNTITAEKDEHPRLDMMDNGDFVVVWDSGDDEVTPGTKEVRFRRFTANGTALDAVDQTANEWFRGNQRFPDVAYDGEGNFVIAWQSGAGGTGVFQDGELSGIFARLFDASGTPIDVTNPPGQCFDVCATASPPCSGTELIIETKEICVNDHKVLSQDLPRVARTDTGEFVVVWHSEESNGAAPPGAIRTTDASNYSCHGKRFSGDGDPSAPSWQVNTFTLSEQVFPDVAMAPNGNFVITWASLFQEVSPAFQQNCADIDLPTIFSGACDRLSEVYGEEYNADGTVRNAEFIINTGFVNPAPMTALDGIQVYSAVDVSDTGDGVIAWASGPPPSPFPGASTDQQDGDGWGAMARLAGEVGIDSLIFADDFESGDLIAWQ